jgi:hypothetical protein
VKRTTPSLLTILVGIGIALGLLMQQMLASAGRAGITPPITLSVVLGAIAVVVVLLAVPVRRAVKEENRRVDPFYAIRVLVLAKSSALSGALLGGVAVGFVVYLLTRTVPALGSVGYSIGMVVGAIALLAAGLIAEEMCRVPPPTDEDEEAAPAAT